MPRFATFALLILMPLMMNGCRNSLENLPENPLLTIYDTPHGVPPFDRIRPEHYLPAFEAGMQAENIAIEGIMASTEPATVANTLLPLVYAGELLDRVSSVFYNVEAADTNDELQAIAEQIAPRLSEHSDSILQRGDLYERLASIDTAGLPEMEARLLQETLQRFRRAGVALDATAQAKVREINQELAKLRIQFGKNVLEATNQAVLALTDRADLAGLPESVIQGAAAAAQERGLTGQWVFTPHKPSMLPFLTFSSNPSLRRTLYDLYLNRGSANSAHDNTQVIARIVTLRLQRAQLLGYPSHAAYVLEQSMAKTPEQAYDLLMRPWPAARERANNELRALMSEAANERKDPKLTSSDWWYYAEKRRKAHYDLDEEMLRPYLSIDSVRGGIFTMARELYGLRFEPRHDLPVYHKDVEAYEVFDADGSHLAVLYMDYFPRPGKGAGAWCTKYESYGRRQDGTLQHPVVSIVCNFTRPVGDAPALLSFDETETLFHEFGHALHAFFSRVELPGLGRIPRDFVELPSQIMEHWASEPDFLRQYARHYQTGESMPDELIDKLQASRLFNQGFATTEYLAASILDMAYHMRTEPLSEGVTDFERHCMDNIQLPREIEPRYRSTYFSHIFDGGYSSGYYSYIWSEALDCDAYSAFRAQGKLFDTDVAQRFRSQLLQWSGARDASRLFRDFMGRDVDITPLLRHRGLDTPAEAR